MRTLLPTSLAVLLLLTGACSRTARVAPSTGPALPAGVTMALMTQGDSLFNAGSCQRCHGAKGIGAQNGPSLVAGPWLHHAGTYEEIVGTITTGIAREKLKDTTRRFPMGARGGQQMNLKDEQIRAVAAYVWSISRDKR
jgi:mono/diheme cytochrome c family protein